MRLFERTMASQDAETDESLMGRVRTGDQQAFAALVGRHSGLFYSAAYRMCSQQQEAEDIVQEAFLKLWQKPEAFDPARGVKFSTWFYRVVTNLAIDRMRRKKPQANPEVLAYMPDRTPLAEEVLAQTEQQQALERAIAKLPERQRMALNLCFYEGLSNKDAADILEVGVKALESLLMRAKKALRDELLRETMNEKERRSHYAG